MANDSMKKELVAHKVYSAWQFITYTEKNIDTVQYCADTINNIIGKMTMKTVRWQQDISTDFVDDVTKNGKKVPTTRHRLLGNLHKSDQKNPELVNHNTNLAVQKRQLLTGHLMPAKNFFRVSP